MLNRPASTWSETPGSSAWDSDRAPTIRLLTVWIAIATALIAVAVRMGQLQLVLKDDFASALDQRYFSEETIPAREGRILAADGSILAGDEEQYDLQVHYGLIQEPADPRWLKAQARSCLSTAERKDKLQVAAEEQRVLQRRREQWHALSQLTGLSSQDMDSRRNEIQRRVERIREAVLEKRAERRRELEQPTPLTKSATIWQSVWEVIRRELTEPPDRQHAMGLLLEETEYHTVIRNIDSEIKAEVEAHPERYPGVRIQVRMRRVYPHGELAAHVIGLRTRLTAEEIANRKTTDSPVPDGTVAGDAIGRSGLESEYDSHLRGVRGMRRLSKNRRGEVIDDRVEREPRHGRDLVLTLDIDLQRRAEQLLDEALANVQLPSAINDETNSGPAEFPTCPQGGCLIALDVYSGAILAAASAPRFDLNLQIKPDKEQWNDLLQDPRKPFFPRISQMKLPPGSVFKIISAVAAIESGKVDPDVPISCRGYLDRPEQYRCLTYRHFGVGHGETRLADALCRSCNVYFFMAARRMGPLPLVEWSQRFGIGQVTGIDLPSEAPGRLPAPKRLSDTLGMVIGQADLLVTPLQMARVVAAVANDGMLITPHLAGDAGPVSMQRSPSFDTVISHPDPKPIEGLHGETLRQIREGLDMVVNDPAGTAFKSARSKNIRVAGKTGTAETNGGADHAWFAGFVPLEQPRVAFVVVLEHGGSGGRAAGPVAKKFVDSLLDLGLISPARDLVGQ